MQQWVELAATAGSLCNFASAAINLAATAIKYRRERKPTRRKAHHRPDQAQGGQPRPLALDLSESGQDLPEQGCRSAASDQTGGELGRDQCSPVARLSAPNAALSRKS